MGMRNGLRHHFENLDPNGRFTDFSRTHAENSTAKSDKMQFPAEVCCVMFSGRAKKQFGGYTPTLERVSFGSSNYKNKQMFDETIAYV